MVTGKFVVSAFAMLLLVFLTDFATICLATDNVRPRTSPRNMEHRGLHRHIVVLGVAMVAETWFWTTLPGIKQAALPATVVGCPAVTRRI